MNTVFLCLIAFVPSGFLAIQCQVCDSFKGYCDFDGTTCVGAKCSRRTAPLSNGLIREQRLCVPSDSPIGCRKAVLWDELEGIECVCDEQRCNDQQRRGYNAFVITLAIFKFLF